jgi:hypothetical protein
MQIGILSCLFGRFDSPSTQKHRYTNAHVPVVSVEFEARMPVGVLDAYCVESRLADFANEV